MIYVNQTQLDQVKYLIEQSAQGNHILFTPDTIKRVAANPEGTGDAEAVAETERLLEQMILCPTIDHKRAFLANLDPDTYDEVARLYLSIVQNTTMESKGYHQ